MFHMSRSMHAQMHWRPDAITRTGVIEPMWVRQVSPVDMARHTIDPFIASVRGRGPAVSPYPSPEDVAYAAGKLAQLFARGKTGTVCMGTSKITVGPNTPASGGIVGTITAAAQELARGGTVTIQIGGRAVIVCNSGKGGEPQIAPAPSSGAPTSVPVRSEQQAATAPSAPTPTAPAPAPMMARPPTSSMPVRPEQGGSTTPAAAHPHPTHPAHPAHPAQFGTPLLANMTLPKVVPAGHVPWFPYFDYAKAYRMLNYDDNVWARRNFQARLAGKFAPQPIAAMHASLMVPIKYARSQAQPALNTRAPMVQQRWAHPEAVWPGNASINVRKEQR